MDDDDFDAWLDEINMEEELKVIAKNRERRKLIHEIRSKKRKACEIIDEVRNTLNAKKDEAKKRHIVNRDKWNATLKHLLNHRLPQPQSKENIQPVLERLSEESHL